MIKKTFVLLLTLCAIFALAAFPAAADDVIINPELIFTPQTTFSVLVDGTASGALSGVYPYGETATVTAPDVTEKTFRYWTNGEGEVISYNKALTVTMYANTTVNAVYGASAAKAKTTAAFLNVTRTDGEIVFNAIASAEGDITEAGIRYSTTKRTLNDIKGEDGVTVAVADEAANWTLVVTPENEKTTYYAVVYTTVGTETTYSAVKTVKLSELQNGVSMVVNLGDIDISGINADFCVVTFDANGGEGAMAPQGVVKGEAAVLNANTFTREGYTFNGWRTGKSSGTSYKDGDTVTLSEDTTLYAQWSLNYASSTVENIVVESENGAIKLEPEKAAAGQTVRVTATPDAGYKLAELTAKDAGGKEVEFTKNDDGTYSFKQPNSRVIVEAKFAKVKFVDVPENSYYAKAVDWAVEKSITNGVDETRFAPNETCTRAQAVTFLWRALGCPEPTATKSEFTDVTGADAFYFKAVLWAAENGITLGYGDGKFGVNDTVNRAQMVTFMARALNGKATTAESFTDVPEGAFYADAAAWAKENGISNGIGDNKFGSNENCARAQIVTMLYRYFVK